MADNELVKQLYSLCRVALENYSIDLWRKKKNEADKEVVTDPVILANTNRSEYEEDMLHGSIYVEGTEIRITEADLFHALEKLREETIDRYDIIINYYILEMTDQEIADKLKIPKSTVTWRRHKAILTLEKYLNDMRQNDL